MHVEVSSYDSLCLTFEQKLIMDTMYRNCGVQYPSWSEIFHFAKFLGVQLESCEKSVFSDEMFNVKDAASGFKRFAVKFMIRMSRVLL